jgi:glycosyltransferase involved in cell wall biosynthesis
MPLFSVIIPVFNRASMICTTLESVLSQDFNDFEIIVIDDGSTDELFFTLSEYINSGSIRYFHQSNTGVSAARNKGAEHSLGNYLLFLDSDDRVSFNWISDYAEKIVDAHPDILYCGIHRMKDNKVVEYTSPLDPYRNGKEYGNVIPGSFCIKKTFFQRIGGYDQYLAYGENTELGFRIKYAIPSTAFITAPNLLYVLHENSHGKNARNKMNGLIYTIQKHPRLFNGNKDMKRRFLSIAGVAAVQCHESTKAKALFWDAWKLSPFNFNIFMRLLLSLSPMLSKKIWLDR